MITRQCDDRYAYGCKNSITVRHEEDFIYLFSFTKNPFGDRYPMATCKQCVARHANETKKNNKYASESNSRSYSPTDYPGGK